jgi:Tfp pilus assembly protein FimT
MGTQKNNKIGPLPVPAFRVRGLTVMELLIVMVLAAIILALGAPQFSEFQRNNRLTEAANDTLAALQLARTEAVKRQAPVALCATSDPEGGNPGCSPGTVRGWIVFEDANGNCERDAGDDLVRVEGPLRSAVRANADGNCALFSPTGFAQDLAVGLQARRIMICDDRGLALQAGTSQSAARGIQITRPGRAYITRDMEQLESWDLACP